MSNPCQPPSFNYFTHLASCCSSVLDNFLGHHILVIFLKQLFLYGSKFVLSPSFIFHVTSIEVLNNRTLVVIEKISKFHIFASYRNFQPPICDVNPQHNTRGAAGVVSRLSHFYIKQVKSVLNNRDFGW